MRIKQIALADYRNYAALDLPITADLCVFVGQNAQGKTNLLESIYYTATARSFRTTSDDELIRWGADEAIIQCAVEREVGESLVRIRLARARPKSISINGQHVRRHADLFGCLNVVVFSPDDLQLVKGSPGERRRFLDVELAQVSPTYRRDLTEYSRILRQRNNLLREIAERRAGVDVLDVWDEQLCRTGSRVMVKRAEAALRLSEMGRMVHSDITGGAERLDIRYQPFFAAAGETERTGGEWETLSLVEERFRCAQARLRAAEIARGQSLVGPQRDDLEFYINGYDARSYGSQGQQRTAVLSCKLAELEFMRAETGEYPVLLLDDVMSELDADRRHYFLGTVRERVQTFITTTSLQELSASVTAHAQVATIDGGHVIPARGV